MSYIPNTIAERKEMLGSIGVSSVEELFAAIPENLRLKGRMNLPQAKTEFEVLSELTALSEKNTLFKTCFRGAGAYRHYIPSVVRSLASREEFVTAYTPYQPELSQGVLQSIFEYQTVICELTGMDASNAGVYDGAQAAAEAIAMFRERKRTKAVVSAAIRPMTLSVIKTYCRAADCALTIVPARDGVTDLAALKAALDGETAAVYMEQPNYYGIVENAAGIADAAHGAGAKLIMGGHPISLAVLKTPAEYSADAAVGEGQPLGMPLSFGGPYLGFMAVKARDMRRLPGRIVGKTADAQGRDAYVLTLQAREQHIRREKAVSSICSNEALCSLTAAVYCAAMGKEGLRDAANQCHAKAKYAAEQIASIDGFGMKFGGFFFCEFVTSCPVPADRVMDALAKQNILGGLPIKIDGEDCILWCVTEVNTKAEIDALTKILKEVIY
ncbi:MAG: aminomethyl-transferring glycine dehydrogenase subunit GcvPA [Oscillospiraceae bacterium]|nr:aminomethyl-transferring glycine dehydrogenase subunit GcvPA [Oscillospiraceae bacterium]